MTGRWWLATSADILRVERKTPTTQELAQRLRHIADDPRQKAYVEGLVAKAIEEWRQRREKPRS